MSLISQKTSFQDNFRSNGGAAVKHSCNSIIYIGIGIIVLMLIIPPYREPIMGSIYVKETYVVTYSFFHGLINIDYFRLLAQILVIAILTTLLYIILPNCFIIIQRRR